MNTARPCPISLTDSALAQIRRILAEGKQEHMSALKLSLRKSGCAGMAYQLDHVDQIVPSDEKIEFDDFTLLIEQRAFFFLLGTRIDWQGDKFQSGFTFENPNVVEACGCGQSVRFAAQS